MAVYENSQLLPWASNSEIVSSVFEVLVSREDLWGLAVCARVSRHWKRIANVVFVRNVTRLSSESFTKKQATEFQQSVFNAPDPEPYTLYSPPFRSAAPLALYYNALLRRQLIGRGSFSRVYHFGGLQSLCIKVASGGLTDLREREQEVATGWGLRRDPHLHVTNADLMALEHRPALETAYFSSGSAVEMLSHSQVTCMLAYEFARLQTLSKLPLPPSETASLYPAPLYFGYIAQTSYYVMEKLLGFTLRKVLRAAAPYISYPTAGPSFDAPDLVEIDFIPLVERLLRYMHFIMCTDRTFHGDIKPENIVLVPEGADGWRLRLIDPIPREDDYPIVVTLAYNPAVLLRWNCDVIGIILVLFEIHTGFRPFDRFIKLQCWDDSPKLPDWITDFREILQRLFGKDSVALLMPIVTGGRKAYKDQFVFLANLLNSARAKDTLRLRIPRSALPIRPSHSQTVTSKEIFVAFAS